jgi:hypothetical protein
MCQSRENRGEEEELCSQVLSNRNRCGLGMEVDIVKKIGVGPDQRLGVVGRTYRVPEGKDMLWSRFVKA